MIHRGIRLRILLESLSAVDLHNAAHWDRVNPTALLPCVQVTLVRGTISLVMIQFDRDLAPTSVTKCGSGVKGEMTLQSPPIQMWSKIHVRRRISYILTVIFPFNFGLIYSYGDPMMASNDKHPLNQSADRMIGAE
jgi:hypothetical protein